MQSAVPNTPTNYARCIEASRRIRWDIDADVIRGRQFDYRKKFLPDGLSKVTGLQFLDGNEQMLLSQIQGRTYANMFGLVERFIGAKILEISRDHWLGNQTALEALVRFTDEELKHQELFRRIERMIAAGMPKGYQFLPQANEVASAVLGKSSWAVLALTCHIELFTQAHYRESIEPDSSLSELWKDIFLYHWREESQHAILDEIEWLREDAKLSAAQRDQAVSDLIDLVSAVDGLLQVQAVADADYFGKIVKCNLNGFDKGKVGATLLRAYRWQYIGSGIQDRRFAGVLSGLLSPSQLARIQTALAPLIE